MASEVALPLIHQGKVRDVYDAGEDQLLLVASDRVSAFDVVMTQEVPNKGRVLTALSKFWFEKLSSVAPNHLISTNLADFPPGAQLDHLEGRTMLVKRAEMLPIECIVRGYLSGSAWKEYRNSGTVHGMEVHAGLGESAKLPEPMFTPSIKAEVGDHDENISFDEAVELIGSEAAQAAQALSLALYEHGSRWAAERGIIIADTKFELGVINGQLAVADELLTPDSSRFWPVDSWAEGTTPPAFDKQPLRDWLEAQPWDKKAPAPTLPPEIIESTRTRYIEAYERLSERSFAAWAGVASTS